MLDTAKSGANITHAFIVALLTMAVCLATGAGLSLRLIRRASDRGVFVLLDSRAPSRLLSGLPAGVEVQRLNLAEAVAEVRAFLQLPGLADNRPHQ